LIIYENKTILIQLKMKSIIILLLANIYISNALLFGGNNWNDLKVTWGINPLGSNNFVSMPRVEKDAIAKGWKKEKGCQDGINGNRYALNGDRTTLLVFDENGVIAGIAHALPKNLPFNFPSTNLQAYFDDEGDSLVITAYFVDPTQVCTKKRAVRADTGDRLVIQSKQKTITVALKENEIDRFWSKGKCFWTMGNHYWADITGPLSENTKSENFLPIFLLYNGGNLNGFGWAFNADIDSVRVEHPTTSVLGSFFSTIPKFFYDPQQTGVLSTQHIYFTSTPQLNTC